MTKSFRRTGSSQAPRARDRSSGRPLKNSRSVSTERQAAPCFAYDPAIAAGSKGFRSRPRLGLAFLISAIPAGCPAAIFRRSAPTKSRGFPAASARRRMASVPTPAFAVAISLALTARIFSRMSATCELLSELDERLELRARSTALDELEGLLHAVLERRRLPRHVDRGPGVESHDVARRAAGVLQGRHHHLARLLHAGHAQRLGVVHR